jgi:hypothetical protein
VANFSSSSLFIPLFTYLAIEMRLSPAFLLAISGVAVAQTAEPSDFDVTAALEEYGVDVSAIPQLAGLQQRSIGSACTAAVSTPELSIWKGALVSNWTDSADH